MGRTRVSSGFSEEEWKIALYLMGVQMFGYNQCHSNIFWSAIWHGKHQQDKPEFVID